MTQNKILINIATQTLKLYKDQESSDSLIKEYGISTGKNGIGCQEGTGQTPLGKHIIAEKIGHKEPINSVFIGRVPTGEIYSTILGEQAPERDWILSRILWLSGEEEGYNKGANDLGVCDTYQRYIYIHGTPDSEPMGEAMSHGCIRMRNNEVIELFELVEVGCKVEIVASTI